MSEPYEEFFDGRKCLRPPPGARHEEICQRLHTRVAVSLAGNSVARLLPPRTLVEISLTEKFCPDLTIVTAATNKIWLAVEVVGTEDHRIDTVTKKAVYERVNLPRLWMVDPRYDNVEVYHGGGYGLTLKQMLACKEVLNEPLLPGFEYIVAELFQK
jgi:Uma2 family endonuclease